MEDPYDLQDAEQSADDPIVESNPALRGRYMAHHIWATDPLGFDLTVDESLFVRSYLIDRDEIKALQRLGYDHPKDKLKRMANRHLSNVEVQDAIKAGAEKLMQSLEVTAAHVTQKFAEIAFTDLTDIMQFDGTSMQMLPSHLWPAHVRTAVKSVKHGQFGLQVEFHDKTKALDVLAKQTGAVESDELAEQRRANAAAEAAMAKIMEVVKRNRELSTPEPQTPAVIEYDPKED